MKQFVIALAALFTVAAQAHTLEALPSGLAHELLHYAPFVLPVLLAIVLIGLYRSR